MSEIAEKGPDVFYRGPIGAEIVRASEAGGGILTKADFAPYQVRERRPIECDYRGDHVISSPPPSSGGVTLCETLNVLQGYDLAAMGYPSAAVQAWPSRQGAWAAIPPNTMCSTPLAGSLPLGAPGLAGAAMFGAHDVRGGAGKATPGGLTSP